MAKKPRLTIGAAVLVSTFLAAAAHGASVNKSIRIGDNTETGSESTVNGSISVGSGAITVGTAIVIAAVFEFLGAAFAGGHVTKTIRKDIIDPGAIVNHPELLVFGMLAALLAAALWLMIASFKA